MSEVYTLSVADVEVGIGVYTLSLVGLDVGVEGICPIIGESCVWDVQPISGGSRNGC